MAIQETRTTPATVEPPMLQVFKNRSGIYQDWYETNSRDVLHNSSWTAVIHVSSWHFFQDNPSASWQIWPWYVHWQETWSFQILPVLICLADKIVLKISSVQFLQYMLPKSDDDNIQRASKNQPCPQLPNKNYNFVYNAKQSQQSCFKYPF